MVELWALRDGLNLAIQLGIGCLEVELDAKALCEELTRKAADLQWENEHLKWMVKALKVEVEETPPEHKSADVATSTSSSTNCPLFLFNRPPPEHKSAIYPNKKLTDAVNGRLRMHC
nr:hypothetical protein CFP56_65964 [Quercus suber]